MQYALHAGGDISMTTDASAVVMATGPVEVTGRQIDLTSQTAINVRAPQGIQNVTPTAEQNVVTQALTQASDAAENIGSKFGAYFMAITLYGLKLDFGEVKVDRARLKVSQTALEVGLKVAEIKLCDTINLSKSALQMLG
ncbi:MAG TPA: hypothetical protein RMH99_15030, partial [Sandaracinaceae bacterium LLY-WYZ-13_1]|nr:hypothetical protein [Sandaracinaceae bacterium LLY-WYZ-13_1]